MATEQEEARPIRLPAPPRSKSDRTASWDKTARLWDAATPAEMARQMKESDGDRAGRGASDSIAGSPAEQIRSDRKLGQNCKTLGCGYSSRDGSADERIGWRQSRKRRVRFDCRLPRGANRITFRNRKWTPILKRRLTRHGK